LRTAGVHEQVIVSHESTQLVNVTAVDRVHECQDDFCVRHAASP